MIGQKLAEAMEPPVRSKWPNGNRQGRAPAPCRTAPNPHGGAAMARKAGSLALHDELMGRVLHFVNLKQGWKRVKANRGAPGIDGVRIENGPAHAREHWADIRR